MKDQNKRAIVLLSGGLDSSTCAYIAKQMNYELFALTAYYGQRANREIESAKFIADALKATKHIILQLDLSAWGGSALTDKSISVPTEGVDLTRIPTTYVPSRNLILLSLATAWAEVLKCKNIFIGVNSIDYSGYPDARPEFIKAFQDTISIGTVWGSEIEIVAPLQHLSKKEIIEKALSLGVPIENTWSCYQNGPLPCGVCDACRIRNEAMASVISTRKS